MSSAYASTGGSQTKYPEGGGGSSASTINTLAAYHWYDSLSVAMCGIRIARERHSGSRHNDIFKMDKQNTYDDQYQSKNKRAF